MKKCNRCNKGAPFTPQWCNTEVQHPVAVLAGAVAPLSLSERKKSGLKKSALFYPIASAMASASSSAPWSR